MQKSEIQVLVPTFYVPYPLALVEMFDDDERQADKMVTEICGAICRHETQGSKPFVAARSIGDGIEITLKHDASQRRAVRLIDDVQDIVLGVMDQHL